MRWKDNKNNRNILKRNPFLVLPRIEVCEEKDQTEMRTKNPGLRLFTKAWQPKKEPEDPRPLTATLEKPQVLNINLVTKIDMSLIRKEFLCITNLCRVPLNALSTAVSTKVRRNCKPPASFNQQKRCPPNRPLSLPSKVQLKKSSRSYTSEDSCEDDRSSSSQQTHSSLSGKKTLKMNKIKSPSQLIITTKQQKIDLNDANNNNRSTSRNGNNFKTYRVSKNRAVRVSIIDKTPSSPLTNSNTVTNNTKLPQPCKTCGRADQPERFHSHPVTPSSKTPPTKKGSSTSTTINEKVPIMKKSVQKPVAIKYKSKLQIEKRKTPTSPTKKIVLSPQKTPEMKTIIEENIKKNPASAKGPRTLTCYICGREFGTMSLPLHEPKCIEKWERENADLPPSLRRKRPIKPDRVFTKNEWNAYAWESAQANLVPCLNCGRTFYPDRLLVHQRSCKPQRPTSMAKLPKEIPADPSPVSSAKPRSAQCKVCGRLFGTKSIKIHEPQCLKKWHVQNDNLPPNEREPMYEKTAQETPVEVPTASEPEKPSSATKKPPMFPCYLCGRLFSVNSIYIHEPQCLKKWKAENDKLPSHKRRPEPMKPDIKFTLEGKIDHKATGEANWLSHLEQLVPCKLCGRTFNPDRVDVHERSCKGLNRKFNDIKIEILQ